MRWSRNELRRQLADAKRGAHTPSDAAGVVVRVVIQPPRERRWREAAAHANQPLVDWMATVADQAAELALARHDPWPPGPDGRADGSQEGLSIDRGRSGSRSDRGGDEGARRDLAAPLRRGPVAPRRGARADAIPIAAPVARGN